MRTKQRQAVWELCRQGFPLTADDAATCWDKGLPFRMVEEHHLDRTLKTLIEECNWELERSYEHA